MLTNLLRWILLGLVVWVTILAFCMSVLVRDTEPDALEMISPPEERLFCGWLGPGARGGPCWLPYTQVADEYGSYVFRDRTANVACVLVLRTPDLLRQVEQTHVIGNAGPESAVLFPGTKWEVEVQAQHDTIIIVAPDLTQFSAPLMSGDEREIVRRLFRAVCLPPGGWDAFAAGDEQPAAASQPRRPSIVEVVRDWAVEHSRTDVLEVLGAYSEE